MRRHWDGAGVPAGGGKLHSSPGAHLDHHAGLLPVCRGRGQVCFLLPGSPTGDILPGGLELPATAVQNVTADHLHQQCCRKERHEHGHMTQMAQKVRSAGGEGEAEREVAGT